METKTVLGDKDTDSNTAAAVQSSLQVQVRVLSQKYRATYSLTLFQAYVMCNRAQLSGM